MRAFTIIWLGRLLSLLGTALRQFAILLWAWELTGSATALAMVSFFSFGPMIALGPLAGALVDRWGRRRVMILSDLVAGITTALILVLHLAGSLQLWHLYVAVGCVFVSQAFQFPAFSAAVAVLVPRSQHGRTGGMISLAEKVPFIVGPLLAAALLKGNGMAGVIALDLVTLASAMFGLLLVRIPEQARPEPGDQPRSSLWADSLFGFGYMLQKPGFLGMQVVLFVFNLTSTLSVVLLAPLILARTGDNASVLGLVQSTFGIGGAVGGVVISLWGGPSRRIHGFLLSILLCGLFGRVVVGAGQGPSLGRRGVLCGVLRAGHQWLLPGHLAGQSGSPPAGAGLRDQAFAGSAIPAHRDGPGRSAGRPDHGAGHGAGRRPGRLSAGLCNRIDGSGRRLPGEAGAGGGDRLFPAGLLADGASAAEQADARCSPLLAGRLAGGA